MDMRTLDKQGRLTLGKELASKQVIVDQQPDGVIMLTPAAVIPAREAWLYDNPEALKRVREGLEQVKRGELVDAPDFEADAKRFGDE